MTTKQKALNILFGVFFIAASFLSIALVDVEPTYAAPTCYNDQAVVSECLPGQDEIDYNSNKCYAITLVATEEVDCEQAANGTLTPPSGDQPRCYEQNTDSLGYPVLNLVACTDGIGDGTGNCYGRSDGSGWSEVSCEGIDQVGLLCPVGVSVEECQTSRDDLIADLDEQNFGDASTFGDVTSLSENKIIIRLRQIINLFTAAVMATATLTIIVSGIQYMLSAGNPQMVSSAMNKIYWAVGSIVMLGLGWALLQWILPGGAF